MAAVQQLQFSFGPLLNSNLFSNHWLEHRLSLEPEWNEIKDQARSTLEKIITLWSEQEQRVSLYDNEQSLEYAFVQPIFEYLGWKIVYQTYVDRRKPDYALFLDDESLDSALKAGKKSLSFWENTTIVADAKAWDVSLERPTIKGSKKEYPPQQIEWYLDRTHLDFGILTNGKIWRLSPRLREHYQPRFQTFLEFNLLEFLQKWVTTDNFADKDWLFDEFLHFPLFFGPIAYKIVESRRPLITRAIEGGSEYRLGVGEGLKERAFEALRLCIEGFLCYDTNNLTPERDLEKCRESSFIFLYRLLFIMYAEDRKLLPYRINQTYTNNRSLGRLRIDIVKVLTSIHTENVYSRESTTIYDYLLDLFDLIDRGHKTYGVPAYNGGLFDDGTHSFFSCNKICNWYLARVIDQLSRAEDPEHPKAGLFRVDYRDLAIQHLGKIYEGLLELIPRYATEEMLLISGMIKGRSVQKIQPLCFSLPKGFKTTRVTYKPGAVYLETNKNKRRSSGSYYTPDHIVQYIVENTLEPLCTRISKELDHEIESLQKKNKSSEIKKQIEVLKNQYDDRILNLQVLDPAMGSGHFLISACQYLAEQIATHPHTGDEAQIEASSDESSLTFWKRKVMEKCLFGVDTNPLAVELAKLALWLETVAVGKPLTFLDHHLNCGNSLIGVNLIQIGNLPAGIQTDGLFTRQVEAKLDVLLEPFIKIEEIASDTMEIVHKKQQLYKNFEHTREPFRIIADLWCSVFGKKAETGLTAERYQEAVSLVNHPKKLQELCSTKWIQDSLAITRRKDFNAFHWELEFPEVFFNKTGRIENPGFDAIIGNPPYDVLAEKESVQDLSSLRDFVNYQPLYNPSKHGKNNLYKLFVCRALDLLSNEGMLGFITPMPILGDEQAVGIRKILVDRGTFTSIESFPQKDNPKRRVFPEAKLSTTVFCYTKNDSKFRKNLPFKSRIHPGAEIEEQSPSLILSSEDILKYDPNNFTIVSCSQLDWDLATRIMKSNRLLRLGTLCTSFQGEVNETNERVRNCLSNDPNDGTSILRGSNICMYIIRKASQGETLYLREEVFLSGKKSTAKAYHGLEERIGFQRSSPQNNFRRLIACYITAGNYCFDTVSYIPKSKSSIPLFLILALLNSKLLDWYFRLGSTNSKVNEYQFNNLPCPVFALNEPVETNFSTQIRQLLIEQDFNKALYFLSPYLKEAPFNPLIIEALIAAAKHIIKIENGRGEIPRSQRSNLAESAQHYQKFIDLVLYRLAGLSENESAALEENLVKML